MGHQVRLYLTPSDLCDLEVVLRAKVPMVSVEYTSLEPGATVAATLDVKEMGKTPLAIFLVRPEDLSTLHYVRSGNQDWTVDVLRSPVVKFSRCFFDGSILRQGRLFYDAGYYGSKGEWIEKPADFRGWASRLFATVKRSLERDPEADAYLGREARNLSANRTTQLVSM